ncbi:MAG TPA: hypothetical protein VKW04_23705 [Planctomycetota bacterium]|nr:hypothetical protein [Planctomycetota bacterium]
MDLPIREGLEEYAKSLDLSPTEVIALLEDALARDPLEELPG